MTEHFLIVGGTKGIGRSTVKVLLEAGARISVIARTLPEPDQQLAGVYYFIHDILQTEGLAEVLEQICVGFGPLCGVALFQRHRGKENSWAGNLEATLTATRRLVEAIQPFLRAEGDKSLVFLSSIASGSVADEQDEGYHAAKAGLGGLCRYYAYKLGPQGIRVNCVAPGALLKEESQHYFLDTPGLHDLYCQVTPLRRMGTAQEVGRVIRFLLTQESSFITGQEIVVDGGVGLHWQESLARMLRPEIAP